MILNVKISLLFIVLLTGTQLSCSDTSLTSGKSAEGSDRVRVTGEDASEASDGSSKNKMDDSEDTTMDDEKIIAMEPSVISGSYLVCKESSENLVDVWCGLRKENQKVTIQNLDFYFEAKSEGGESEKVQFHEIDHPFWTYKLKNIDSVFMKESVRLVVHSEDSLFTVSQNGNDGMEGLPPLPDEYEETKIIETIVKSDQKSGDNDGDDQAGSNQEKSESKVGDQTNSRLSHDKLPESDDYGIKLKNSPEGLGKDFNFDVNLLVYQDDGKENEEHFHAYDLENQLNGVNLMDIGSPGKKHQLNSLLALDEKFYIISVNADDENSPYIQINDNVFKADKLSADTIYPNGRPLFSLGEISEGIKVTVLQFAFEDDDLDENNFFLKRKAGDVSSDKLNKEDQYRDGAFVLQFVKYTGAPVMIDVLTGRVLENVAFEVYMYRH